MGEPVRKGLLVLTAVSLPVIFLLGLLGVALMGAGGSSAAACPASASSTEPVKAGTIPNGWAALVEKAAADSGVPSSVLAAQLETESGWNPKTVSPAGAQGLSQFVPGTWASYGGGKDPFDPAAAIAAQGAYMKALLDQVGKLASSSGQPAVSLALAGYNAGVGRVFQYGGIPPYPETRNYVAKILGLAQKYAQNGDAPAKSVAPPASCTGLSVSNASVSKAGDDYPWPGAPVGVDNPATHFNYRECVDFAWFRFMQQIGTPKPPFKLDAAVLQMGSAAQWGPAWQRAGWQSGHTPVVGAIIWYRPGAGGAGSDGHVAVVKSIYRDGSVLEEGYNMFPNADHAYYTRRILAASPSAYLYIPGGAKP